MSCKPDSKQLRRDLRAIYGDGVGYSIMVGVGETYVPAFALAIGMTEVAAGWIVALPLLLGAVLQLVSPAAIRRLGSHRRWVVLCAGGQSLCCLGYVLLALVGHAPDAVVFLVATLYWGTGMAAGPAWNTWVGTLLPARIRTTFLARRARGCQVAVLVGLVAGGLALQSGAAHDTVMFVFAMMFLVAGISRIASTLCLLRQSEPQPLPENHRGVSPLELLGRARHRADGRLLFFMLAVQVAVQISGPFFTPYMLSELKFSYAQYLSLIATAYVAKIVAFPFLGSLARRFSSQWLLYGSAVGIVPLAALWIVSDQLGYLLAIQVFGGVAWAGYELATLLLLFERIHPSERTSVLTLFNVANAAAIVGGAIIGGTLLKILGAQRETYFLLFGLSCFGRVLALILLTRLHNVTFTHKTLVMRVLGVRPNSGSIDAPLVSGFEGAAEVEIEDETTDG